MIVDVDVIKMKRLLLLIGLLNEPASTPTEFILPVPNSKNSKPFLIYTILDSFIDPCNEWYDSFNLELKIVSEPSEVLIILRLIF